MLLINSVLQYIYTSSNTQQYYSNQRRVFYSPFLKLHILLKGIFYILPEHTYKYISKQPLGPNKKPQRYFSNIAARNRYGRNQFGLGTVVSRYIIFAVAGSFWFRTMYIYIFIITWYGKTILRRNC